MKMIEVNGVKYVPVETILNMMVKAVHASLKGKRKKRPYTKKAHTAVEVSESNAVSALIGKYKKRGRPAKIATQPNGTTKEAAAN